MKKQSTVNLERRVIKNRKYILSKSDSECFFLTGCDYRSRPDGVIPPNAPRIQTPEELQAWIEARKKNWPSKDNVERKVKNIYIGSLLL